MRPRLFQRFATGRPRAAPASALHRPRARPGPWRRRDATRRRGAPGRLRRRAAARLPGRGRPARRERGDVPMPACPSACSSSTTSSTSGGWCAPRCGSAAASRSSPRPATAPRPSGSRGELQPDLVVLDLGLPDLAGHEVLTRIRAASPAPRSSSSPARDASALGRGAGRGLRPEGRRARLPGRPPGVGRRARRGRGGPRAAARADQRPARSTVRLRAPAGVGPGAAGRRPAGDQRARRQRHHPRRVRLPDPGVAEPATLRIDVIDRGGTPEPQPPSDTEEHGRGLTSSTRSPPPGGWTPCPRRQGRLGGAGPRALSPARPLRFPVGAVPARRTPV